MSVVFNHLSSRRDGMEGEESSEVSIEWESGEHVHLGDQIRLTLAHHSAVQAADHHLSLPNGLRLTYGEITALAGDFYGTDTPISNGLDPTTRKELFTRAWETLAVDSRRQPAEATAILSALKREIGLIHRPGIDPGDVYHELPDMTGHFTLLTMRRPRGQLNYFDLARINFDHFGTDAINAYSAGHSYALEVAASGDLELAYAINAFADHFLQDLFAAGHLRTPRRLLHGKYNMAYDYCAKLMHDEDNALGLDVINGLGDEFRLYGDQLLLGQKNEIGRAKCIAAVQVSVDEVYTAWKSASNKPHEQFEALTHIPTLASISGSDELDDNSKQRLKALFLSDGRRRQDVSDRLSEQYGQPHQWWAIPTVLECGRSGRWRYPMTLEGLEGAAMEG